MKLLEQVPLAPRCTLGVGGPAAYFVEAHDEPALFEAIDWADRFGVPVRVLGGGSNVVIADGGFDGLVVQIALRGIEEQPDDPMCRVTAAAGEPWDALVARAVQAQLAGIECLSGIPGLVGATPIQNVGAYGQEVADTIERVRAYDRIERRVVELEAKACAFGYRDSRFKSQEPDRYVVLAVTYALERGGAPTIRYPELARRLAASGIDRPTLSGVREAVLELRRGKSMVIDALDPNRRSCGSFFLNPIVSAERHAELAVAIGEAMPSYPQPDGSVKLSAAWLIERAGFSRGERQGRVGLSSRHSLALVCHDGARADELIAFARSVRRRVLSAFDILLRPEPVFWGFSSLDEGLPDERLA